MVALIDPGIVQAAVSAYRSKQAMYQDRGDAYVQGAGMLAHGIQSFKAGQDRKKIEDWLKQKGKDPSQAGGDPQALAKMVADVHNEEGNSAYAEEASKIADGTHPVLQSLAGGGDSPQPGAAPSAPAAASTAPPPGPGPMGAGMDFTGGFGPINAPPPQDAGAAPPPAAASPDGATTAASRVGVDPKNAALLSPHLQDALRQRMSDAARGAAWTRANTEPVPQTPLSMPAAGGGEPLSAPLPARQPTPEEIGRRFDTSGYGTPGKFTYEAKPVDPSLAAEREARAFLDRSRPSMASDANQTKEKVATIGAGAKEKVAETTSAGREKVAEIRARAAMQAAGLDPDDPKNVNALGQMKKTLADAQAADLKNKSETRTAGLTERTRHNKADEANFSARTDTMREGLASKIDAIKALKQRIAKTDPGTLAKIVEAEIALRSPDAGPKQAKDYEDAVAAAQQKYPPAAEASQQPTAEDAKAEIERRKAAGTWTGK